MMPNLHYPVIALLKLVRAVGIQFPHDLLLLSEAINDRFASCTRREFRCLSQLEGLRSTCFQNPFSEINFLVPALYLHRSVGMLSRSTVFWGLKPSNF